MSGRASWTVDAPPRAVVVRLFWRTSGRGTADLKVLEEARLEATASRGQHPFRFRVPPAPYSFSGKLISLVWSVEAVLEPADVSAHQDFVVSPSGREILLQEVAAAERA